MNPYALVQSVMIHSVIYHLLFQQVCVFPSTHCPEKKKGASHCLTIDIGTIRLAGESEGDTSLILSTIYSTIIQFDGSGFLNDARMKVTYGPSGRRTLFTCTLSDTIVTTSTTVVRQLPYDSVCYLIIC
jgi:hypothetical protein